MMAVIVCKSGAMAGVSIAALLQALRPGAPMPDLAKPDPEVVDRTYDRHPAPQCRLDTYFQGALCAKPWAEELSDGDPSPGACAEAGGFDKGLRPRCWYKPPAPFPEFAIEMATRSKMDFLHRKSILERVEETAAKEELVKAMARMRDYIPK